jgi:hypothetical protein
MVRFVINSARPARVGTPILPAMKFAKFTSTFENATTSVHAS